ncbi:MAG TPA: NAD-dependent epimerase/dehydratase family protein [Gemmatimonadota bacterium]|nr:NAD-dependent epimerase/dehydratase family protein [Gemmatimonadota bacterium]
MNVLLIGGTRNIGHHLAVALVERGHRVTTFNRGRTPDELGNRVERLHGDRAAPAELARAIGGRSFDAVVDTIAMRGSDTRGAVEVLDGRVGHYVHFSTGQVYLVRLGCPTPAREEDYSGPLRFPPPAGSWEAPEHRYGIEKRECEDALQAAWDATRFPATRLRLPMIHGERDPYARIQGTVLRLLDGGPLLVPLEPGPKLKHVYQADVVDAVVRIVESAAGKGRAYNIAQDEAWTFEDFIQRLAAILGVEPRLVRRSRAELVAASVFPACAPFSNPWMSVLDNGRAKKDLGLSFRRFDQYLPGLVEIFRRAGTPSPAYVAQREREQRVSVNDLDR